MNTELAWAAGFFDGEGSVGWYGNAGSHRICACVAQKELQPLRRFLAAMGFGRIGKPQRHSGCSYWQVTSIPDVQRLHALLVPYLSEPKRAQFARTFDAMSKRRIRQPHSKQSGPCAKCEKPASIRGLCHNHYHAQWKRQKRARVSQFASM